LASCHASGLLIVKSRNSGTPPACTMLGLHLIGRYRQRMR
jgi:hypothetical protein